MMNSIQCPLCSYQSNPADVLMSSNRSFIKCRQCWLIYALPQDLPNPQKEMQRYENHKNSIKDEGYVKFLNQAIEPALPYLQAESAILDYGCGPVPVLSQILKNKGYNCDNYDPFFYPQELNPPYHAVFSTEVFEHFHHPAKEIEKITDLLVANGVLVLMTEFYRDMDHFKNWWYTRDFTHVEFYHIKTIEYISRHFGYELLFTDHRRVVILELLSPLHGPGPTS